MTIEGRDSSFSKPTAQQALQAKAAGVRVWSLYLATRAGVNLASTASQQEFDRARLCGGTPLGFCSGFDDPLAVRQKAAAWNVRPCLDVESGIRGDGPWVQAWLDASGAGLYGGHGVHGGRRAAFYVLGAYPRFGDPFGASWDASARPDGLCGWQWAGSHVEFGCVVDSTWFDDGFAAPDPPAEELTMLLFDVGPTGTWLLSGNLYVHVDSPATLSGLQAQGLKTAPVDQAFHEEVLAAASQLRVQASGTVGLSGSLTVS